MTIVLHLISLVIRTTRIVHRHDESTSDRTSHNFLGKLKRGVLLSWCKGFALLVLKGISEGLNRFSDGQTEDAIDLRQHLGLSLVDISSRLLRSHHITQLESELTQLRRDNLRCHRGIVARIRLRHHLRGHKTIFVNKIGDATEGTAIIDRMMEEELHTLMVDRLLGRIDHTLQHQIGLFELIPEEEISLRKLHVDRIALGQIGTQHIQSAEHPATA